MKDDEFRRRHNTHMKKYLNSMIENNIKHIEALSKNREYYKKLEEPVKEGDVKKTISLDRFEKAKKTKSK